MLTDVKKAFLSLHSQEEATLGQERAYVSNTLGPGLLLGHVAEPLGTGVSAWDCWTGFLHQNVR